MSDTKNVPSVLTDDLVSALKKISTATLTFQLQIRGIRSTFFSNLKVMHPEQRMVGRARTLRYVAVREDMRKRLGGVDNAQRRIVESIEPGDVLVIEAREVDDAATIGDIYATRLWALGGVGIVSDGGLRDTPAIKEVGVPVYYRSSHAATLGRQHMPLSTDEPVTCSGVFVEPGDVIVGDAEGAMVIPADLVEEVVAEALLQEDAEAFALERVQAGEATEDLFPIAPNRKAEFEAWRMAKSKLDKVRSE